jgi:hypothetical protein
MWGLTMKDLAIMDKIKGFPWKQLRALGIYKPMGSHKSKAELWGWDYLTTMCSRIVNEQMGFRADELDIVIKRIQKKSKLLYHLFGQKPDEDGLESTEIWPKYFEETFARCVSYGKIAFGACSLLYFISSLFQRRKVSSIARGLKITLTISAIGALWLHYISITPWGKDIRSGIAQQSPFPEMSSVDTDNLTLTVKTDVLFSNRLDSPFLAGQNLIYNHQPGNGNYCNLLSKYSASKKTPAFITLDIINVIKAGVEKTGSRFVAQNDFGDWEVMEDQEILSRIQKDLFASSNEITSSLAQEIKYLKSDCRYGRKRHSMMRIHAEDNLSKLESRLIGMILPKKKTMIRHAILKPRSYVSIPKTARSTFKEDASKKANVDALKTGDIVEGYVEGDGWFKGKIVSIDRRKRFAVAFDDGDYQQLPTHKVRRFNHFEVGETVALRGGEVVATISYITANGYVSLLGDDDDEGEVHIFEISRIS